MNNKLGLLGGLVALQLLLIAAFWFGGGADSTPGELLDFAPEAVDELSISDQESELVLVREEAGWQVGALPADDTKIDELLQKMSALAAPWPVAQSAASAARFEVQKDNFQRRVVLRGGTDVIADLYLGTSPGYQRVHARRTDSDDVYSIGLSNFELAVGVDNWLDKGLLALEDAPARVVLEYAAEEMSPQTLERRAAGEDESDTWLINGMPAAQDAATTYARLSG